MKNCKILLPIILTIIITIQAYGADLKWSNTGFYAEHSLEGFLLTQEKQLIFPNIVDGIDHSFIIYDSTLSHIIFSKTFDERITSYTFSDDMKYLAIGIDLRPKITVLAKPNIYIYDLKTNDIVQTIIDSINGYYNSPSYLLFSPKNNYLFSTGPWYDKNTIWDLKNNKELLTIDSLSIPYQRKYIDELKFSADEKYFLYINNRTSVLIDLDTKQKINRFGKGVYLDFSVENNVLFRQFEDNLDILDFKNGNVLKTIHFDYQIPFNYNNDYRVKYLPGKNLLILYDEPNLSFYDLNLDSIVYSYQIYLFNMFFSENERYLGIISDSLKFIDIDNREIISSLGYNKLKFQKDDYKFYDFNYNPDELIFLDDNEVLVFYIKPWMGICAHGLDEWDYFWDEVCDFKSGKFIRKVPQAHNSDIVDIEFSPDGRILASAGLDSAIMLWDVNSGKFISKIDAIAFSMNFSPDLLHFTAYGNDQIPRIYDLTSGDVYKALPKQSSGICFMSYTPSGNELVIADSNGKITVYNTKSFSIDNEFQLPGKFACKIAFKNDSTWLAAYQSNKEIIVLNLIKNEIVFKTPSIEYFLLSKNGKILFVFYRNSNYGDANYRRIWDIENNQEIVINGFEKFSIMNLINTNDENKILINAVNKTSLPYTPEIYQLDLLTGNTTLIYNSITQCFFENIILSTDNKYLAISSENAALNLISYPYYTNNAEPIIINKGTSEIFPNPASDFINLRFKLAKSSNISIKIYDILGNPVAELANEWCGEGWQNKQIDISKLQNGTYYCRLGYEEQLQYLKMIVIR